MRLLRPTNQKLKVTFCLGSILSISACEPIVQSKGQTSVTGASLYRFTGGHSNPGKEREYRNRNITSGSANGRLGSLNAGGRIQGEAQLQKAEAYQEENISVLTFNISIVPSLKESKAEVRWIHCKEEKNRYIEEIFKHKLTVQHQWGAK